MAWQVSYTRNFSRRSMRYWQQLFLACPGVWLQVARESTHTIFFPGISPQLIQFWENGAHEEIPDPNFPRAFLVQKEKKFPDRSEDLLFLKMLIFLCFWVVLSFTSVAAPAASHHTKNPNPHSSFKIESNRWKENLYVKRVKLFLQLAQLWQGRYQFKDEIFHVLLPQVSQSDRVIIGQLNL